MADSEKIKGMLAQSGFDFTDKPDDADFILYNTCAVREHAEDRVFGNVGALKKYKEKTSANTNCTLRLHDGAGNILQTKSTRASLLSVLFSVRIRLHHFPELMYNSLVNGKRIFERGNDDNMLYEGFPVKRDGIFKGWLPIMYGCNNFCTYCIVPYVRGRERSRRPRHNFAGSKADGSVPDTRT